MKTRWPWLDPWARRLRWLAPAALLALVPKCGLCLLAWLGLASALGLGGRELCGAPADPSHPWLMLLAVPPLVLGGFALFWRARPAFRRSGPDRPPDRLES
ncbi:MAG TPA: hypothetical protein VHE13_17410 [Opitutus sp.]|nr:hypothetical protein [Opitutus sp.]